MYFTIAPFINSLRDKNLILLNKLNELILNLANNINDKNYCDIIIFLQKNKFDSNKAKLNEKYLRKLSSDNYRKMLSEIASSQNQYNPVIGGYFQMIPQSSPEYAKAKQMYEDYISKTAKQAELEKNREFYLEKEKLEVQKLEIKAQMAATEAVKAENERSQTINTGNNVINMIIDQAVQIGVPHLLGLLL